ncbi:hypothetical protein EGR_01098 [Echinococcus granulosus]|uniref:Transmembrane protein 170 n=1 Tax=Echinococcus granulosus TaxID=6210 RepID=U6JAK6_ECHGR|nr:hypothetical protein EGR_01098 [Echinococcus granulosus]EUB63970.1 hypothetical protein EGR_01098 [Echinococcus granulosus]CDS19475.1 Transmembrane protein 170 [Echinococcus granulosus]
MDETANVTNWRLRDIWWKVFLWGAACNGVIYGVAMIIAIVNLRAHKLARIYAPVLMLVMGLLSTFTVLLVSSLIVAFIFDSMALSFNQLYAFVSGFVCSIILFIFSIIRFPATL